VGPTILGTTFGPHFDDFNESTVMSGLTDLQLNELRDRLIALRRELEARLKHIVSDARPVGLDQPIG